MIKTIKNRRSVRFYDPNKEVEDEKIQQILECGHMAPSAKNAQPWYFVVITNKELIKKIMTAPTPDRPEGKNMLEENDERYIANVPKVMIVVFFEKEKSIMLDPEYYGNIDKTGFTLMNDYSYSDIVSIGTVVENMSLAAVELGLGSCIVGDLLDIGSDLYKWLEVDPDKYQLVSGIKIGYPAKNAQTYYLRNPLSEHIRRIE